MSMALAALLVWLVAIPAAFAGAVALYPSYARRRLSNGRVTEPARRTRTRFRPGGPLAPPDDD